MKLNKISNLKFIYFLVLLFIIFLSIGYSSFNVILNIDDTLAYVRINKDIRITGFSINSVSTSVVSDYEEYNYNKVSSLVTLPNSDSSITYRVDITNFESAEMGIYSITGLPDNLEYSISEYTLKDKICDDVGNCNLGISKDIYITVKYKEDGYDESNTKYNINLDFEFKEIYDVEYSGIENNGYPEYIMDGEILEVTFTDFIPYNVVPYIDGIKLGYDKYTYEDGVLTVNEVTGNVMIEYIEKVYLTTLSEGTYFKEETHISNIKTISFVDYVDVPSDNIATYDLSKNTDGTITGWIDKDYNLYVGSDFHIYGEDLANAFKNMTNVENITFNNLDTSEVTRMSQAFWSVGSTTANFLIKGLNEWNVSNVVDMSNVFAYAGHKATTWNIGDLSKWDISNVTNMNWMFYEAGMNATEWNIGDLSEWDTSNVETMSYMFRNAGYSATEWSIGDLSDWNVSNVTDMSNMFDGAGYSASTFNIGSLSNWNTSKVTDTRGMFSAAGCNATTWNIGDISKWDVSQVTDMYAMFYLAGISATTFNIGNLDKWDTSNVTDMSNMFERAGYSATEWNIGDLSDWDVSSVKNMYGMFSNTGFSATTWNIGDLLNWDVSKVANMGYMFNCAGYSATEWNIGDLSKWNTSNVTNMRYMFNYAGKTESNWALDLSTKEVTREDGTTYMAWDVSKVTSYDYFNNGVESKVTPPVWVN